MKRRTLIGGGALLAVTAITALPLAGQAMAAVTATPAAAGTESNLEIIRAHYAASARGDVTAMMAKVSQQVRWTEMAGFPYAGTWIGPQAVRDNVFAMLGKEWKDYRFELQQIIDGGESIVGVGTYRGVYRATGKEMEARVTHVWTLQGGMVVAFEQFTDTLLVRRAMTG